MRLARRQIVRLIARLLNSRAPGHGRGAKILLAYLIMETKDEI